MLIPPRRSTPSLGGHFAQIINEATSTAINTIDILPWYSATFSPEEMYFAAKKPKTTAAISNRKTKNPVW